MPNGRKVWSFRHHVGELPRSQPTVSLVEAVGKSVDRHGVNPKAVGRRVGEVLQTANHTT